MIVEGADFLTRPYLIPNQESGKDFTRWLNDTEREICFLILGRPLTRELLSALDSSSLEERFEKLINGDDEDFEGLKKLLVPSIYCAWLDPNQFKNTAVGIITNQQPANTTLLDNSLEFQVDAWNKFVKLIGQVQSKDTSTLWNYMNKNKADFPTWKFKEQKYKNRFLF